jgi:cell division protein FtsL
MMARINLLLLGLLMGSALWLVHTSYEGRRLFAALDKAKNEQQQLDTDFKRLDAERQAQATHLRVEKVAREKLQMRAATAAVTQYVSDPAVAAVASGALK